MKMIDSALWTWMLKVQHTGSLSPVQLDHLPLRRPHRKTPRSQRRQRGVVVVKGCYLGFIDATQQVQLKKSKKSQALNYIYIVFRNGSRQSHSRVPIPGRRLLMHCTHASGPKDNLCGAGHSRDRVVTYENDDHRSHSHDDPFHWSGGLFHCSTQTSIGGHALFMKCLEASSFIRAGCSGAFCPTHI